MFFYIWGMDQVEKLFSINCIIYIYIYRGFLTTKEMHNMGLRITGATGEAKLKVSKFY